MIVKDFETRYGRFGGMKKLTEMRSLYYTKKYIADHFEVSQERVRQWMLIFFGVPYEPQPERREAVCANMVEFAQNNSFEDFRRAFRGS